MYVHIDVFIRFFPLFFLLISILILHFHTMVVLSKQVSTAAGVRGLPSGSGRAFAGGGRGVDVAVPSK